MKTLSKKNYHHGDLRTALIDAATDLIQTQGSVDFAMSEACKLANVSKAAPYRHFANKTDLLMAVADQGFTRMRELMNQQAQSLPEGSDRRITAIGIAYIEFASREPHVFKLMFGNASAPDYPQHAAGEGKQTFQILLQQIVARTGVTDTSQLMQIAVPLWTLVHGASMLKIDQSYERIYPDADIEQMIADATRTLLAQYPEK